MLKGAIVDFFPHSLKTDFWLFVFGCASCQSLCRPKIQGRSFMNMAGNTNIIQTNHT